MCGCVLSALMVDTVAKEVPMWLAVLWHYSCIISLLSLSVHGILVIANKWIQGPSFEKHGCIWNHESVIFRLLCHFGNSNQIRIHLSSFCRYVCVSLDSGVGRRNFSINSEHRL